MRYPLYFVDTGGGSKRDTDVKFKMKPAVTGVVTFDAGAVVGDATLIPLVFDGSATLPLCGDHYILPSYLTSFRIQTVVPVPGATDIRVNPPTDEYGNELIVWTTATDLTDGGNFYKTFVYDSGLIYPGSILTFQLIANDAIYGDALMVEVQRTPSVYNVFYLDGELIPARNYDWPSMNFFGGYINPTHMVPGQVYKFELRLDQVCGDVPIDVLWGILGDPDVNTIYTTGTTGTSTRSRGSPAGSWTATWDLTYDPIEAPDRWPYITVSQVSGAAQFAQFFVIPRINGTTNVYPCPSYNWI